MSAANPEQAAIASDLARAEDYGGPIGAALAMQLATAGIYKTLLDSHTINALARRSATNATDDLDSLLGAAVSCTETGNEVVFMGPAKEVNGYTSGWQQTLSERTLARVISREPTKEDIKNLFGENWALILHASGEAFMRPDLAVHPVLITGTTQRSLIISNPGTEHMPSSVGQRIATQLALGGVKRAKETRVSLFGVRRASSEESTTVIGQAKTPQRLQSVS